MKWLEKFEALNVWAQFACIEAAAILVILVTLVVKTVA